MDRRVGRTKPAPAIPTPVGHLLLQQMVGNRVETVVVIREVREDTEYHPRDARLAHAPPSVVDAAVALEPAVEKVRAGRPRLPVVDRQTKYTELQNGVGRRAQLDR